MPIRTCSLNSREFYEALCPRPERPWIEAGSLPRDPVRRRPAAPVEVWADSDAEAGEAFGEWLARVNARQEKD